MSTEKSFDRKLNRILADSGCSDFILADAKDGDMGFGISAPGPNPSPSAGDQAFRTLAEYRQAIREVTQQGLVDIMLMSVSTCEQLAIHERLFAGSPVTPAIRANDTTDIWLAESGNYKHQPSLPFRTATIEHAQYGKLAPGDPEDAARPIPGANLGLYSITFNNDAELDRQALERYREFRIEAERRGFRHFLEVFTPNAPIVPIADIPRFVNDSIARCLAGVPAAGRPCFLKIPYYGPRAMAALVHYDRTLVVGILGGAAGTTLDAFQMLWEAKKHGARAALFGRKINRAEHQLEFVRHLHAVAQDQLPPAEAVRAYHAALARLGIQPHRSLSDDLVVTQPGA